MSVQECPNCHYGKPAEPQKADDCAQCFYTPETSQSENAEDCAQCFYTGTDKAPAKQEDDCNQCFYGAKK